jgi:hypothetical protein
MGHFTEAVAKFLEHHAVTQLPESPFHLCGMHSDSAPLTIPDMRPLSITWNQWIPQDTGNELCESRSALLPTDGTRRDEHFPLDA